MNFDRERREKGCCGIVPRERDRSAARRQTTRSLAREPDTPEVATGFAWVPYREREGNFYGMPRAARLERTCFSRDNLSTVPR